MTSAVLTDQVSKVNTVWGQDVDTAVYNYLTSVSGTNTITATGPAGLAAYAAGLKFRFIPTATNTAATTINITGTGALGARNIFSGGVACVGGELTIGVPVEITDDGTRFHLSGPAIGRTIAKRKTADESVTSSTTLQDDDHLTFAIAANEEWCVSYEATIGQNISVSLFKIALTVPSGATFRGTGAVLGDGGQVAAGTGTGSGTAFLTSVSFGSSFGYLKMKAWILNGATPGSVTLQWAQGASSGTALTFFKGSFLQATRVA